MLKLSLSRWNRLDLSGMQADLDVIRAVRITVERRGYIDLPSNGQSMFPLIRQGDLCRFVSFERSDLSPGDILLFISQEGILVGHRYLHTRRKGEEPVLVCKGDSNLRTDTPVPFRDVIGRLLWIKKENNLILTTHFQSRFFRRVLTSYPGCSKYIAMYLRWKKTL